MSDIDDLYALPPDEFVAARNALAARLKKDGRAEEAAEVKALRRPPMALWAVNQVARRHPEDLGRLVDLGGEVRAAQLEGRAEDFRRAARERAGALRKILDDVEGILEEAGAGASHATRAGQTIEAAAADDESRPALLSGALRHEVEPGGFGDIFGMLPSEPAPPRKRDEKRAAEAEKVHRRAETVAEQAREARREAEALAREADDAEERARVARRAAERAVRRAEKAEAEAEQAARRVDDLLD